MDAQGQAVRELREKLNMNRREFCRYFDIPYRTVCDWEAGKRRMPDYVLRLMTEKANEQAGDQGAQPELYFEPFPEPAMSEKHLNNLIYLFYLITEGYKKKHGISSGEFLELNEKHDILGYAASCPELFDNMTAEEIIGEVDSYVGRA